VDEGRREDEGGVGQGLGGEGVRTGCLESWVWRFAVGRLGRVRMEGPMEGARRGMSYEFTRGIMGMCGCIGSFGYSAAFIGVCKA